jgi:hypothetical protein
MEASGIAVEQRVVRVKKEKAYRRHKKFTLALFVCLSKLLVLP